MSSPEHDRKRRHVETRMEERQQSDMKRSKVLNIEEHRETMAQYASHDSIVKATVKISEQLLSYGDQLLETTPQLYAVLECWLEQLRDTLVSACSGYGRSLACDPHHDGNLLKDLLTARGSIFETRAHLDVFPDAVQKPIWELSKEIMDTLELAIEKGRQNAEYSIKTYRKKPTESYKASQYVAISRKILPKIFYDVRQFVLPVMKDVCECAKTYDQRMWSKHGGDLINLSASLNTAVANLLEGHAKMGLSQVLQFRNHSARAFGGMEIYLRLIPGFDKYLAQYVDVRQKLEKFRLEVDNLQAQGGTIETLLLQQ